MDDEEMFQIKRKRVVMPKAHKDCEVKFCPNCDNLLDQNKKCRVCKND